MIKVFITIQDMEDGRTAVGAEMEAIGGTVPEQSVFAILDRHLKAFNEEMNNHRQGDVSKEQFDQLVKRKQN